MDSSILIASPIMPILLAPLSVILAPLLAMRFSIMFLLFFYMARILFSPNPHELVLTGFAI
jgi:hypothetical protein